MAYSYGEPVTEEERRIVHKALTGEETPPLRGTRRLQIQEENKNIFLVLLLAHGAILAAEIYLAWKAGWLKW